MVNDDAVEDLKRCGPIEAFSWAGGEPMGNDLQHALDLYIFIGRKIITIIPEDGG